MARVSLRGFAANASTNWFGPTGFKSSRSFSHGSRGRVPPSVSIPGVKSIVAVSSAKGGVGKSTVAVNLAVSLSNLGMQVGLADCDIFGPSIPKMMHLSGKPFVNEDKKLVPLKNFGVHCMSMGFLVGEEESIAWRGPMVMSAVDQLISGVSWGPLDILVLDLPPGTGDTHLTLTQRFSISGAIVVSTPQEVALLDARRGVNLFQKVNVPVLGIIENMSYYLCQHCNEKDFVFGEGGAQRLASELSVSFLGGIPLHRMIREDADGGSPVALKNGPESEPYHEIAQKVKEAVSLSPSEGTAAPIFTRE